MNTRKICIVQHSAKEIYGGSSNYEDVLINIDHTPWTEVSFEDYLLLVNYLPTLAKENGQMFSVVCLPENNEQLIKTTIEAAKEACLKVKEKREKEKLDYEKKHKKAIEKKNKKLKIKKLMESMDISELEKLLKSQE